MSDTRIPMVDLAAQHAEVADRVATGWSAVLAATAFVGGPDVEAFEAEYATYAETAHCVGVASGTDAIELMIRGLGIGAGDEVILPANTFIATAEAVVRAGADVVLVDCSDDTLLIDPARVEAAITGRTRAIIGVDLYGQIAPFEDLAEIIGDRDILLLEDAAQSQGARRNGRRIGHGVRAAATSFYPGKNLGAYGDAGAVVTDDGELAETMRAMSRHGGLRRYEHDIFGFNSRLDTVQAVVLRAKLERLDGWNDARRAAATRYEELLGDLDAVRTPVIAEGNEHVWHLYVVRVSDRDRLLGHLNDAGIGAAIHYPNPIHRTGAFGHLPVAPGTLPVAEESATELLSLPIHPHLTAEQQERIAAELRKAL